MSSEQSDVIFARISYTSDTAVSTLQVLYSNYRNSADLPEVEDSRTVIVLCGLGNPRRPHIPNRDIY